MRPVESIITNQYFDIGQSQIYFNSEELKEGLYIYEVKSSSKSVTGKIIKIKE